MMKNIENYFRETIALAVQGRGKVFPNPEVGCVIVKNGEIIGRGFHEYFGGPHAEVNAFLDAQKKGFSIEGSQVFVSLEPCAHTPENSPRKKTPACTNLLIEQKVLQVHILLTDPNPEVSGKGVKALQKAGIEVFEYKKSSLIKSFSDSSEVLLHSFFDMFEIFSWNIQGVNSIQKISGEKRKNPENKNPVFTTLKLAQTSDGCITQKGKKTPLTGKKCREYTLELRDLHQAILVGSETFLVDNPELKGKRTEPLRIILDRSFRLREKYLDEKSRKTLHIFRDTNFLLALDPQYKAKAKKTFSPEIFEKNIFFCNFFPENMNFSGKIFDLQHVKSFLAEKNIVSLFVEGGAQTAKTFLDQAQVDTCVLYTSPHTIPPDQKIFWQKGIDIKTYSTFSQKKSFVLGEDRVGVYGI
jgi:diaminohydroxyphosphoribosylaminopyrimidine deaminase/5-amino-6-(5-phosphoribosylamino)uracil reductase